ncbi:MAG: DUF4350 domain-containing protein [Sandaracinaceae bacterium]
MRRALWRIAVVGAVVLGVAGSALMCARVQVRGRYASAFSTLSAGPEGTRGLYLLAERLGARPRRWSEDLGRLPPEGGMLVALGSCDQLLRTPMGRIEAEALAAWVADGGTLLVAGVPDYLRPEDFGLTLTDPGGRCQAREALLRILDGDDERRPEDLPEDLVDDPGGTVDDVFAIDPELDLEDAYATAAPLEGLPVIGLRRPMVVAAKDPDAVTPLLSSALDDAWVGATAPVGTGRVVALGSASPFQNRDLATDYGAALFARLVAAYAPAGPVLFDEYHLGIGQRRSLMRYLRQVGVASVALQLLVIVALALWRAGARFGSPIARLPPAPGGTASYVEGVGLLYEKSQDPAGVARALWRRALARLRAHFHRPDADEEALGALLEARVGAPAGARFSEVRDRLTRPVGTRDLPRLAGAIDAMVHDAVSS